MNLGVIYDSWGLQHRGAYMFNNIWTDPRGLSGSEVAFARIAQELEALGHKVTLYTAAQETNFGRMEVRPESALHHRAHEHNALISFNTPAPFKGLARGPNRPRTVFIQYVNSFEYCHQDFWKDVDAFVSPSRKHREMILGMEHQVDAGGSYKPDPETWHIVPLACDADAYNYPKVPGKVVHISSPDRGLHWALQEWSYIKRAVPHATLHIYYRVKPWIENMKAQPYWPPIENQRSRALFIENALGKLKDYGVVLHDAVSRETLAKELGEAECLAYPCDTVRWSEGFSCSILEACAARAAPVIFDTDALGDIYQDACVVVPRGDIKSWRTEVVKVLTDEAYREQINDRAQAFARDFTWKAVAEGLTKVCER